jgi:hypothetical protein
MGDYPGTTGNPPAPTSDWFFYQWSVMYLGSRSWVDGQYSQTTTLHLRSETYLEADFYSPIHTNNPTSPITWGTKQRITGTANQYSGQSLSVVYYPYGNGMGPPNRNGVPPFGSGNAGYAWTTVTVNSGAWDTGYIYPALPISLGQQLPQTYDVYAIWACGSQNEVDSNVVSFTLNPATPQIAAPTLTPASIPLGQSVTITDEIFSSAFVNSNDLTGTLTVQARKQGTTSWTDVASQQFTSNYGYSTIYGQYGDYYDLSTSWTPPEAASYDVRIVYSGNHYFVPINSPSSPLTVSQPTYDVALYAHCNTESADVSVAIAEDSSPTGFNTPHTFTGLTGTHTFTVPNTDTSGHQFKQWSTGETTTTITVSGGGAYTAYYEQPPPTYQFTVIAHCNTESSDISVNVVLDDSPPGYPTPYTFTSTIATHKFTVPTTDSSGHPFKQWSTGETSTSLTVSSAGTYTAFYGVTQRKLTVSSAHDSPSPANGDSFWSDGQSVTSSVTSPVTEGSTVWICTGWTGTGSVNPPSGTGTTVTFTITQDSTITWNWYVDNPPSTPSKPQWVSTEQILVVGQNAIFQSSASDPDNDQIRLVFDWGDGKSDSTGLVNSGETVSKEHAWSRTGMFQIAVKAVDEHGLESGSSSLLDVTVCAKDTSNWAGYVVNLENSPVVILSVEGGWNQPSFKDIPMGSAQFTWIGIGGNMGHPRLLQAGIQTFTLRPFGDYMVPFFMAVQGDKILQVGRGTVSVSAGDAIHTTIIQVGTNQWQITVEDLTKQWAWNFPTVNFTPDLTSVEWIHEPGADKSGIAYFSPVAFTKAQYSLNGVNYEAGSIEPASTAELHCTDFVYKGNILTLTSLLSDYELFTITYLGAGSIPTASTILSLHSSAYLNVYDSAGNHLGFNATSGQIDIEIPNSDYFQDENGTQYVFLYDDGAYTVELVGNETGDYHLHFQAFSNGTATLDQWSNSTITINETKTYILVHQINMESLASKTVVGKGCDGSVIVTVVNSGNYTENFNVTAYANTTTIGTQLVTLASGNSTTITFTWNTSGFAKGSYTIWAYAWPVAGETYTEDNTLIDGTVLVSIAGDVNGDRLVDISDLVITVGTIPSSPTINPEQWNPNADINNDGVCDVSDLVICVGNIPSSW